MKKALIAAGVLGIVVAAGAVYAKGVGHRGAMMKEHISARIERAEDFVEATPQQRQVIEQARDEVFKAFEARMQDRKSHAGEVIDVLSADKLDTDKLYALADKHAGEVQAMAKVVIPQIQKVHDVLTPAQRQKLADFARKHHGRGGGGGFGGPQE